MKLNSEVMDSRKRPNIPRCTGGKAPRKMISIIQRQEWERNEELKRQKRAEAELRERNSKEIQTFPSTSDSQIQCSKETSSRQAQTDYSESIIKVQKNLDTCRGIIKYQDDQLVIMQQKLHDAERLYKGLLDQHSSLCTKDCCKDYVL